MVFTLVVFEGFGELKSVAGEIPPIYPASSSWVSRSFSVHSLAVPRRTEGYEHTPLSLSSSFWYQ